MSSPRLPADFFDLFVCLNDAEVEYMLVGGYAVMAHGYLRATQDLDVWVRASPDNAVRVMAGSRCARSRRGSGTRASW